MYDNCNHCAIIHYRNTENYRRGIKPADIESLRGIHLARHWDRAHD